MKILNCFFFSACLIKQYQLTERKTDFVRTYCFCFRATELGFQIKGYVTIFNQEFKNTQNFRDGSSKDVKDLEEAFKRFGIEPVVKPDLKYQEIVKEITTRKAFT